MRAADINIGERYIVHIPGSERQNVRYWGRTAEGFLPEQVTATVLAKQVQRENRRDGVRVALDLDVFQRIPERYRNQLERNKGHQGVWTVHSRSVIQSVAAQELNQAHAQALDIDRRREQVRGIQLENVADAINDLEWQARSKRDYARRYLRDAVEAAREQLEALDAADTNDFPEVNWGLSRELRSAHEAVNEYKVLAKQVKAWREIRKEAE